MADTRCANPELQLDVDLMVLEYTLYHAIRAYFAALTDDIRGPRKTAEAIRLTETFDGFVHLFNHNHPAHLKSEALELNIKILEFLVLLGHTALWDSADGHRFSAAHGEALRDEAAQILRDRRAWLVSRDEQTRSTDANLSRDVERQIFHSWESSTELPADADGDFDIVNDYDDFQPGLFHLLPRFMDLSADVVALVGQEPNDLWMNVAGEFMLQASLESLRSNISLDQSRPHATEASEPRLEDCFAWGYVDHDYNNSNANDNDQNNANGNEPSEEPNKLDDLFRQRSDGAYDQETISFSNSETPEWTQTRTRFLSEFHISHDASTTSQTCRLDRLATKYPTHIFHQNLVGFMESLWRLVCDDEVNGRPVLVQIEEGHLRGLGVEGSEFDDFLVRVGLRRDRAFDDAALWRVRMKL